MRKYWKNKRLIMMGYTWASSLECIIIFLIFKYFSWEWDIIPTFIFCRLIIELSEYPLFLFLFIVPTKVSPTTGWCLSVLCYHSLVPGPVVPFGSGHGLSKPVTDQLFSYHNFILTPILFFSLLIYSSMISLRMSYTQEHEIWFLVDVSFPDL